MMLSPVIPFEPILTDMLPAGKEWIAQIKWDGVRMLAYNDGVSTELVNRRGNRRTLQYPELIDVTSYCKTDSVILDGEIVALSNGRPSFHEVMRRDSLRKEHSILAAVNQIPVIYMVFDILFCNGVWTMNQPLSSRQLLLSELLLPHPHVQLVPSYTDPSQLLAAARTNGLEGILCKDINSTYVPGGKDRRWLKRKIIFDINAVVGGVTLRDGRMNALLLGLYSMEGKLHYIGHAGPGRLNAGDWRTVTEAARRLKADASPFINPPPKSAETWWIKPQLVFKVNFLEWNTSGTLRQPVIQAPVDIDSQDCRFEV